MATPSTTTTTTTTKAATITRNGGYEVLQVTERPLPALTPGTVLIRVRFSGLNFADLMARVGLYPEAPPIPAVVGYEGSGIVEKIEADPASTEPLKFSRGSRVLFLSRFGGQADSVVVPVSQVIPIPDSMSLEEAAALPVTYLTAYHAVFIHGNLRKGESILIHAAAGGVGTAAVQLAKTIPGVTIFGTASASKHQFLKDLGVHHTIDYRTQEFDQEVLRITGGKGVNVILDAQGGAVLKRGYEILKAPGRIVSFGFSTLLDGGERSLLKVIGGFWNVPKFSPLNLMDTNRSVSGINMLKYFPDPAPIIGVLHDLIELYEAGKIKPIVDKVFKLSEAGEAHRFVNDRKNVGKVLLTPDVPIEVNLEEQA